MYVNKLCLMKMMKSLKMMMMMMRRRRRWRRLSSSMMRMCFPKSAFLMKPF